MGFTENFNYCLEERGYSAYRFAKIIGVNIQSVVNWKTGTTQPHYSKKVKIADHFGITLAELDGDELPVLPKEGIKKDPVPKDEVVGSAKQKLLDALDGLSDSQIEKLIGIIEEAKKLL